MSAAVKITHMERTPAELRALAAKSDDAGKTRRLLAIAMVLDGASRLDAARQAGMDRQTLRDWVHRYSYNEAGIHGLVSRKAPGEPQNCPRRKWLSCARSLSPVLIARSTKSSVGAVSIFALK